MSVGDVHLVHLVHLVDLDHLVDLVDLDHLVESRPHHRCWIKQSMEKECVCYTLMDDVCSLVDITSITVCCGLY